MNYVVGDVWYHVYKIQCLLYTYKHNSYNMSILAVTVTQIIKIYLIYLSYLYVHIYKLCLFLDHNNSFKCIIFYNISPPFDENVWPTTPNLLYRFFCGPGATVADSEMSSRASAQTVCSTTNICTPISWLKILNTARLRSSMAYWHLSTTPF